MDVYTSYLVKYFYSTENSSAFRSSHFSWWELLGTTYRNYFFSTTKKDETGKRCWGARGRERKWRKVLLGEWHLAGTARMTLFTTESNWEGGWLLIQWLPLIKKVSTLRLILNHRIYVFWASLAVLHQSICAFDIPSSPKGDNSWPSFSQRWLYEHGWALMCPSICQHCRWSWGIRTELTVSCSPAQNVLLCFTLN